MGEPSLTTQKSVDRSLAGDPGVSRWAFSTVRRLPRRSLVSVVSRIHHAQQVDPCRRTPDAKSADLNSALRHASC